MPRIALATGVILVLLGLGGYAASGGASWTALIPALFGAAIGALGTIALKAGKKPRAAPIHVAALIALLGLLGSVGGVPDAIKLLAGDEVARPPAAVAKSVMALLCLGFVTLCVASYLRTRRRQRAQPADL